MKENKIQLFLKIIWESSIIVTFLCILLSLLNKEILYPFYLLPIVFTIGIKLINRYNIIYPSPGIVVLNVIMYIRFVILPLSMIISGELNKNVNNYNYMYQAILMMIFEMITMFIVVFFTGNRERKKIKKKFLLQKNICHFKLISNYKIIIAILLICTIIMIITTNHQLVGGISLLTKGTVSNVLNESEPSGIIGILWQSSVAWVYIFGCLWLKSKNKGIKYSILISAIYILLTFISQTSISRWYTIISFIAVYFLLIKLYPDKNKIILIWIVIPVVIMIGIVSIYKNTNYLNQTNGKITNYIDELFDSQKLEAYFAGPTSVNNAIGLKQDESIGIECLFGDIINNMPIVNHWFDTQNNSVNYYNKYIGRYWNGAGNQIIPLVGQSYIYCDILGTPILSVLSIFVIRFFDRKYYFSQSFYTYIFAFTSSWVGVSTILNMTIILSWVYIRIIPMLLLITVSDMLGKRKIKLSMK